MGLYQRLKMTWMTHLNLASLRSPSGRQTKMTLNQHQDHPEANHHPSQLMLTKIIVIKKNEEERKRNGITVTLMIKIMNKYRPRRSRKSRKKSKRKESDLLDTD